MLYCRLLISFFSKINFLKTIQVSNSLDPDQERHSVVLICMLYCRLLINFFQKFTFFKTIRVSHSLDPDQDRYSVGPDLDPNSLQRFAEQAELTCFSQSLYEIHAGFYGTPEGTCAIFLLTRGHDLLSRSHDLVSRGHELIKILHMSLPGFRIKLMGKNIFTIYAKKCFLSKPVTRPEYK